MMPESKTGMAEGERRPEVLLRTWGPCFESNPDDRTIFGRLEGFGIRIWDLASPVYREFARQKWIEYLASAAMGVPEPWRLVQAAMDTGQKIHSAHLEREGLQHDSQPRLIGELLELEQEPVHYVVHGYAARGEVLVLTGLPKVGKTTLTVHLAVHVARGMTFLDRDVEQTPVLWVDLEQHRRRTINLFRPLKVAALPIHVFSGPRLTFDLAEYVEAQGVGLVIIDSLSRYWNVTDENDAGKVTAALTELRALAARLDVAIVLIHHDRKAGGQNGVQVRGSTALTAAVDVAVSMGRRGDGSTRVLDAISRDENTPRRLIVERADDGAWAALGAEAEVRLREQRGQVLRAVGDDLVPAGEIEKATGLPGGTVRTVLNDLADESLLERSGRGVKNDPFKYRKASARIHSPNVHNENDGGGESEHSSETMCLDETVS